jgi:hypothetical protein
MEGAFLAGEAEGGELKISNRKELEKWLFQISTKSTVQGRWVAIAVAARIALRLAPLTAEKQRHDSHAEQKRQLQELTFALFFAATVARAGCKYPERADELRRHATGAADAVAKFADSPPSGTGRWVAFVAQDAARALAAYDIYGAAAIRAAYAADKTEMAKAESADIWTAISSDANFIAAGGTPNALSSLKLWPGDAPRWVADHWQRLKATIANVELGKLARGSPAIWRDRPGALREGDWQVWIDWYSRRLAGVSDPEKIELVFASIPEAERAKGPAAANKWIRERLEELQNKEAPPQQLAPAWDFFISYSTHDVADAREVAAVLEEAGHSTFAQFKDMAAGNNFVREMQAGLDDSGRVIALYSPNYEKSDHCQAEWSAAYNSDPSGRQRKLIPLLLRPTALNSLARQIVYKSLVGLSKEQRRAAILESIAPKPAKRDIAQIRTELAQTASPQPALNDTNQLDAGPNKVFDKPFVDQDLVELPYMQRTLIKTICRGLPPNAPKILDSALRSYAEHLEERGSQPIVGILKQLASALEKEIETIKATEPELLGAGNADLFVSYFGNHQALITHFPLKSEEKFADIPINEAEATGDALIKPMADVSEKMQAVVEVGQATQNIGKITENSAKFAKDIAPLPPDVAASEPGSPRVTLKRRYVLSTLGFLVALYNILGSTASILATEQGAALFEAVRKAIEGLSKFLI